jgi:hypothetical protein
MGVVVEEEMKQYNEKKINHTIVIDPCNVFTGAGKKAIA